ncbi:uncharacterized protein [Nicotiana tomentosiformis]|uniref:uncharacterized protein n=1 Tax=Nicotiana tomentosiformis TaxID=4098 RepID=UPI00388C6296
MTRGRGRGRGRARDRGRGRGRAQSRAQATTPIVEPQVDLQEEVSVQTVPVGPVQVPEGFIATLVHQDALVRLGSIQQHGSRAMVPALVASPPTQPASGRG